MEGEKPPPDDSGFVQRGGALKKVFKPKIPGRRSKKPAAAAESKVTDAAPADAAPADDTNGNSGQPRGKGKSPSKRSSRDARGAGAAAASSRDSSRGQGRDRRRTTYTQGGGIFSDGFGADVQEKKSRARDASKVKVKVEPTEAAHAAGEAVHSSGKSRRSAATESPKPNTVSTTNVAIAEDNGEILDESMPPPLFDDTPLNHRPVLLPLVPEPEVDESETATCPGHRFPQPAPGGHELIFVQLPTIASSANTAAAEDNTTQPGTGQSADEAPSLRKALAEHGDGTLGKLRIRKSGRIELVLHSGDVFDVRAGTSVNCAQQLVSVDTEKGLMIDVDSLAPEQRYVVIPDLEKAIEQMTMNQKN